QRSGPASPRSRRRRRRLWSADGAGLRQALDVVARQPVVREDRPRVFPDTRQRARSVARRARQPWSRRRLGLAVGVGDEEIARTIVGMLVGLAERQDGRDAGIGAVEDRAPLVAGPGREDLGEAGGGRRPRRLVELRW